MLAPRLLSSANKILKASRRKRYNRFDLGFDFDSDSFLKSSSV
jgi:hypothetical protein